MQIDELIDSVADTQISKKITEFVFAFVEKQIHKNKNYMWKGSIF